MFCKINTQHFARSFDWKAIENLKYNINFYVSVWKRPDNWCPTNFCIKNEEKINVKNSYKKIEI